MVDLIQHATIVLKLSKKNFKMIIYGVILFAIFYSKTSKDDFVTLGILSPEESLYTTT